MCSSPHHGKIGMTTKMTDSLPLASDGAVQHDFMTCMQCKTALIFWRMKNAVYQGVVGRSVRSACMTGPIVGTWAIASSKPSLFLKPLLYITTTPVRVNPMKCVNMKCLRRPFCSLILISPMSPFCSFSIASLRRLRRARA